jgi:hypothetical protein
MSVVVVDGREYRVPRRVADVIRKVLEHADRIASGSKVLRLALRKETITATIEEEL